MLDIENYSLIHKDIIENAIDLYPDDSKNLKRVLDIIKEYEKADIPYAVYMHKTEHHIAISPEIPIRLN